MKPNAEPASGVLLGGAAGPGEAFMSIPSNIGLDQQAQ
jgi:hypothetical protein